MKSIMIRALSPEARFMSDLIIDDMVAGKALLQVGFQDS